MYITLSAILGYLLGSIPFGLILTKLAGTEDIRKIGSGSIGATNVLRTGRKDLAFLTLVFDASKAAIATLIAFHVVPNTDYTFFSDVTSLNFIAGLTAGFAAVVGHNFPVWLKFRGGKGVASAFGYILVTSPMVACLALATWLVMAITTRYSSLSAITAAILVPVYAFYCAAPITLVFYIPLVLLVLIRHHSNFARLFKGQESKITFKKKEK